MFKKKFIAAVLILAAIWATVGAVDFVRVHSFKKPIFSVGTETCDDGGSGRYVGLGYSFDIEGSFMPEDELPGVTKYTYYLFGFKIASGARD